MAFLTSLGPRDARDARGGGAPTPPSPLELPAFLPYACKKLGAPFNVRVDVKIQEEYVSKIDTTKKQAKSKASAAAAAAAASVSRHPSVHASVLGEESFTPPFFYAEEGDDVVLTAVMDVWGRLVGIEFRSAPQVPALLVQIIGLCVPFHLLLGSLHLRWSYLDGATLNEISKCLTASRLTELCLDDSPVPDRNYAVLLERPSQLRHLSLARCELDDEDCAALCAALAHARPAAATLQLLDLASNFIDDAGAHALGAMLRTNRSLRYLNLCGNRITDVGAEEIFKSLVDFPLTAREVREKRLRAFEYMRVRREVFERCLREALRESEAARSRLLKRSGARGGRRGTSTAAAAAERGSLDAAAARAATLAADRLGAYVDPFSSAETECVGGELRCCGNRSLCYLNLRYNGLGHRSVVGLLEVLVRQRSGASEFGGGLVRALVEGNPLPERCAEYERADELLEALQRAREAAARPAKKADRAGKVKSQTRSK